ncbi:hypothetical protein D3C85_853100 [compost metagenome]
MTAQHDGVLAGHQRVVADVIAGRVSDVAGRVDIVLADDLEVCINVQTAKVIAFGRDLLGQRTGAYTSGPDHGPGVDALAIGQGHTVFVDGYDRGFEVPLHAGFNTGFSDFLGDLRAHGAANLVAAINDDHVDICSITQDGAQTSGHFSRRFDPGEASAGHHDGVACLGFWLVDQGLEVVFQAYGLFDLVDVERMFRHAGSVRQCEATTGGQNEFVVDADLFIARGIDVANAFLRNVDGLGSALDELHADVIEQLANWSGQLVGIRLVETWTNAQLGLRRQHRHVVVAVAVNVEQTRGAQSGPHATETCADYQNVLFHLSLQGH